MENTNLVAQTEVKEDGLLVKLTDAKQVSYCSMVAETQADKIKLYNAVNNAEKRLSESANLEIKVKDVFVEIVECTEERSGEVTKCPRTVLIDDKGVGYTAVSLGVFSALSKIFQIFGTPNTWDKPLTIVPKIITKGDKKITTLEVK